MASSYESTKTLEGNDQSACSEHSACREDESWSRPTDGLRVLPKSAVREMNEQVAFPVGPVADLVKQVSAPKGHHIAGAQLNLQAKLTEAEDARRKATEIDSDGPSPVGILKVPVGSREAIELDLPPLVEHLAPLQTRERF